MTKLTTGLKKKKREKIKIQNETTSLSVILETSNNNNNNYNNNSDNSNIYRLSTTTTTITTNQNNNNNELKTNLFYKLFKNVYLCKLIFQSIYHIGSILDQTKGINGVIKSYHTIMDVNWMCTYQYFQLLKEKLRSNSPLYGWSQECFTTLLSRCTDLSTIELVLRIKSLHKYWHHNALPPAIDVAALNPSPKVVQLLHSKGARATRVAMDAAASVNNLETITFLHKHRNEGCSIGAVNSASANGHLPTVQFLLTHRSEGFSSIAIDLSSLNGHYDIVYYLINYLNKQKLQQQQQLDNQQQPIYNWCTSDAIDNACRNGHVKIVKLLLENNAPVSKDAIDFACKCGHLEIVKLLFQHSFDLVKQNKPPLQYSSVAFDGSTCNGHFKVLEYLESVCSNGGPSGTCPNVGCTVRSLYGSISKGNIDIVKYLIQEKKFPITSHVWEVATLNSQLDVLVYLNQQQGATDPIGSQSIDNASIHSNNFDCIQFMLLNRPDATFTSLAMINASENGNLAILELLAYHISRMVIGPSSQPFKYNKVAARGHLPILVYLDKLEKQQQSRYLELQQQTSGFTPQCLLLATDFNHVHIIKFLITNRQELINGPLISKVLERASSNGSLGIIEFICQYPQIDQQQLTNTTTTTTTTLSSSTTTTSIPPTPTLSQFITPLAVENASNRGHVDVVRYYHNVHNIPCSTRAFDLASSKGHLPVIQYLESIDRFPLENAIKLATSNQQFQVVDYFKKNSKKSLSKSTNSLSTSTSTNNNNNGARENAGNHILSHSLPSLKKSFKKIIYK